MKKKKRKKLKVDTTPGTKKSAKCRERRKNGETTTKAGWLRPYQWKKGQSGNPAGGKPKKRQITAYMKGHLECAASSVPAIAIRAVFMNMDPDEVTVGEVVSATMILNMLRGEAPYMKEMFDRVEGKVIPTVDEDDVDLVVEQIREAMQQIKRGKDNEPDEE